MWLFSFPFRGRCGYHFNPVLLFHFRFVSLRNITWHLLTCFRFASRFVSRILLCWVVYIPRQSNSSLTCLRHVCLSLKWAAKVTLVRKEEALYLRFLTQELKIRKFGISCCDWGLTWDFETHWTHVRNQEKMMGQIKRKWWDREGHWGRRLGYVDSSKVIFSLRRKWKCVSRNVRTEVQLRIVDVEILFSIILKLAFIDKLYLHAIRHCFAFTKNIRSRSALMRL